MKDSSRLAQALESVLADGARVATGDSELDHHSAGLSLHPAHRPDVVVYPLTTKEVARVVRIAQEWGTPVVAWGAGSSLEGNAIPVAGGIVLDLSKMDRILRVGPEDMLAVVQAGVRRESLDRAAADHGLRFGVDPGADATLGGMAATNAAGTMTVRYGKMRTNTLSLEAVLADGSIVRTGVAAPKSSAGYDLTGLLVGSEGTLAVITELTVRLVAIPETTASVRASFPCLESACAAAATIARLCPEATRLELLSSWMVTAVNRSAGLALPESPLLMVDLGGSRAAVDAALKEAVLAIETAEGTGIRHENDPTAQGRLVRARHHVHFAKKEMAPGRASLTTDVCVPVSQLAAAITTAERGIQAADLLGGIVAHAGDGNFHVGLMVDPFDAKEMGRVRGFVSDLIDDALDRGGTCTGEHGIGLGKIEALARQHGDSVPVMRAIKDTLDPAEILNPGKVLPQARRA